MAQYTTGSADVTNGSQTVTGNGTSWLANASAGDAFNINGGSAVYTIGSVDSDTQITLASNYAGSTDTNLDYEISTDFTPNYNLYEPSAGDKDWPILLTQKTIRKIDTQLASQWQLSGTDLYYDGGNVGIGTSSPGALLDVESPSDITGNNPIFRVGELSTYYFQVNGNGNVGIGTDSPVVKQEIVTGNQNGISVGAEEASNPFGSTSVGLNAFNGSVRGQLTADSSGYVGVKASTNHPLIFLTNDVEKMRITTGGNVGLGLTPTANMDGLSIEAGLLTLKERATPTADANYGKVYTKNDNKLYFQDGAGTEHEVAFI